MELRTVSIVRPEDTNIILGQSHFIKTLEDLYEALVNSVPGIKFGIGFCESSGECLVRVEGNDEDLKNIAAQNASNIGAGHTFFIVLRNAYPINVLRAIKMVPEVCSIFCATANPVEVVIAETSQGRGVLGVVDGSRLKGLEDEKGVQWRREFLRKIGYKL